MVSKCFMNSFLMLCEGRFNLFGMDLLSPIKAQGCISSFFPPLEGFLSGRSGTCFS